MRNQSAAAKKAWVTRRAGGGRAGGGVIAGMGPTLRKLYAAKAQLHGVRGLGPQRASIAARIKAVRARGRARVG